MKSKPLLIKVLSIIGLLNFSQAMAGTVYVYTGGDKGFVSFHIKNSVPSMTETNRIVNRMREFGFPISFAEIDYTPVFCPWSTYFYPCEPYDQVEFDECVLHELQEFKTTLSDKQYREVKILAEKTCYENSKY